MCVCLFSPLGELGYSQYWIPNKIHPQSVGLWLCSYECLFAFRCEVLAWLVYHFDVLLMYSDTCSLWVVYVILSMFDLKTLGLGGSEDASGRMQIHPIWRIWQFRGGAFVSLLCQTYLFALMWRVMTQWLSYVILGSPPIIFLWCLNLWEMCNIYPSYQTDWPQWMCQCRWLCRGYR